MTPDDVLFRETVEPTPAEVEAAEREKEHIDRMARTFLDVLAHSPEMQDWIAKYGEALVTP